MMKRVISLVMFLAFTTVVFAQEDEILSSSRFGKQDRIIVDVFSDLWLDAPSGVDIKDFNPGVAVNLMDEFRLGESNFHFAIGLGISAHNMMLNADMLQDSTGCTYFENFAAGYEVKRNKFTQCYVDIPLEFRFRTNRKSPFRVTVGGKFGYMMNNHIKRVEDDLKYKILDNDNVNKLHYGLTARIGYKFINLYAYYGMSDLFDKNKGPEMAPISVGISVTPF